MTTTTADEITAVFEALDPDTVRARKPTVIAGRTAFAAIVSRLRALEAENARLKAFVERISHMNAEAYTTVIEPDFTDLIPQAAALLAANDAKWVETTPSSGVSDQDTIIIHKPKENK